MGNLNASQFSGCGELLRFCRSGIRWIKPHQCFGRAQDAALELETCILDLPGRVFPSRLQPFRLCSRRVPFKHATDRVELR